MQKLTVKKNSNYTTIANYHLRDEKLSWKAKGLLTYLIHLPDCWEIKITHLAKASKDKIDSVRSAIQELENFQYIQREFKGENVHSGYDYIVSEIPINSSEMVLENPILGIGKSNTEVLENPILKVSENPILINTNRVSTKSNEISPNFSVEGLNVSILKNPNVQYNVLSGLLHKGFKVSESDYAKYVSDFIATLQLRNDLDKDKFDLRNHFGSWVLKQVQGNNPVQAVQNSSIPAYQKFSKVI